MPMQRTPGMQRFALSLFLGLCLTLLAANMDTIFRGASLTPLLSDTANLPGALFANLFGSPVAGGRAGIWSAMFYLGDLVAYTFVCFIGLSVGNSRVQHR